MVTVTRLFAVVVSGILASLPLGGAAGEGPVPAAASFYILTGDWQGEGSVSENGQQSRLWLRLECDRVSDGWAVLCTMNGYNGDGNDVLAETDLFGVDSVSGKAHWYAVNNSGEAHDHPVSWNDPHTMHAHLDWQQDGRQMSERIVFDLSGTGTLLFRSVMSENGKDVSVFNGALHNHEK